MEKKISPGFLLRNEMPPFNILRETDAYTPKLVWPENSDVLIFALTWVLEGKPNQNKKGRHWLGPGFKVGLNEIFSDYKET